jgi:hypothetical protein
MVLKASILQLMLALLAMVLYVFLICLLQPYRKLIDNTLAVASNALVAVTFIGALLLKISGLTAISSLSESAVLQAQGYDEYSVASLLIAAAVLVLVLCGTAMAWGAAQSYSRLVFKFASDHTEVTMPKLQPGSFHMFLSHQQLYGQDQVEVRKLHKRFLASRCSSTFSLSPCSHHY